MAKRKSHNPYDFPCQICPTCNLVWDPEKGPCTHGKKPEKLIPVQFIIHRDSNDELTFAIVKAKVNKPEMQHGNAFLPALKTAITNWIETTKDGKAAWEESVEDFNVGDLSNCIGDKKLSACLHKVGIYCLDIETNCQDRPEGNWSYDTVLAEPPKVSQCQK